MLLNFYTGCVSHNEHNMLEENFKISIAGEYQRYKWIISSLATHKGELFFGGFDNNLYCTDIKSGKIKWKFKTGGECYFPPIFSTDKIFFTSFDLYLYALDFTGKEIWKYKLPNRVKNSPLFSFGLVVVSVKDFGLIALDSNTGKLIWKQPQASTNLSTTQPVFYSDRLLVGNFNYNFSAFKIQDGELVWERPYDNTILSNPSVYDTILVFGGFNPIDKQKTFINAINIKTGIEIWIKTLNYNSRYAPLAYKGRIYVGTENSEIICLNIIDGSEAWRAELEEDGIGSEIAVAKNKIYFGGYERNFYEYDALTGEQINKKSFQFGIGTPISENGNLYFGTGEGILYEVKI